MKKRRKLTKKEFFKIALHEAKWDYLIIISLLWFGSVIATVWFRNFDGYLILCLATLFFGLLAYFSYIASYYKFHKHFWKAMFILSLFLYVTFIPQQIGQIFIVMFLPIVYALFQLGFRDEAHCQRCLYTYWRKGFPAPPTVEKHTIDVPIPELAGVESIKVFKRLKDDREVFTGPLGGIKPIRID